MEPAGLVNGEGPAAEVGEAAVEEVEYTIVIVGGGPQGLAVLSALHEWYSFAELGMHRDSDYRFRMGTTKKFKKVRRDSVPWARGSSAVPVAREVGTRVWTQCFGTGTVHR